MVPDGPRRGAGTAEACHLRGPWRCRPLLLVYRGGSGTPPPCHRTPWTSARRGTMSVSSLQSLIQRFFTDRLLKQLGASQYTVAAYRDAFRLLLQFGGKHLARAPSKLLIEDLDVPFLGQFLQHLELDRGNCTRTRNNRLAAIHAFFQYVAISEPALALQCQRVLAIPSKRYERGPVEFLTEEETAALVAAPNPGTWIERRAKRLLPVAGHTHRQNRDRESLLQPDVEYGTGALVACLGKG